MAITFDAEVFWDAEVLIGWANRDGERIRCRAGRETIAELPGFTHAKSPEIGVQKEKAFGLMKEAFIRKIERGAFDDGPIISVTLFIEDLH